MVNPNPHDIEWSEKVVLMLGKVAKNPFMPSVDRTKIYCEFANSLSDETFMVYHKQILSKVIPSKDTAKKCKDTQEQVDGIISRIPRLEGVREELNEIVKKARKEYGLLV